MEKTTYYFYSNIARDVLAQIDKGQDQIEISTDLNRSSASFSLCGDELVLDDRNRLSKADLKHIAKKENRIFYLENGELEVLEHRGEGYYKLVPTDTAPLLEISGVKMHISKGINPFDSAGQMARQVVQPGHRVLDTCSGLGYAASEALNLGAREVISVEFSKTVMDLRKMNPWSQRIFGDRIVLIHADIFEYISTFESESFDSIIHDPPRFSLAGELYGEAFYRELFRVLKRRGSLFHYTGNPHMIKRGSSFVDQAIRRLKAAGFKKVVKNEELMGVTALK